MSTRHIHIRVTEELFNRWQKCNERHGERTRLGGIAIKRIVEYLESRPKVDFDFQLRERPVAPSVEEQK